MPNVNNAFGFRPITQTGTSDLIECVALSSYATALFVGDVVIPGGSGDVSGRPSVQQAVAGSTNNFGVIVGFVPQSPDSLATHMGAASTTRVVLVQPCYPTTKFLVNCSGTPAITDIGNGYDITVAAGSATSGRSGMQLDLATANTTTTSLRLVGFQNRPDNAIGAGLDGIVIFAESSWINGPGA